MPNPIRLLNEIKERIGYYSFLFIVMAFLILAFTQGLGSVQDRYHADLQIAAFIFFAIGIVVGVLNAFGTLFQRRPARGLLEGLAVAVPAGLLGGIAGYGSHSQAEYVEPAYVRVGLCCLFAIPTGAVLGLCFDLFQSDRQIRWTEFLSVFVGALLFLVVGSTGVVVYLMPASVGDGINLSDVDLLFAFFLGFSVIFNAFQFRLSVRQIVARTLVLIFAIAIPALVLNLAPAHPVDQPDCQWLKCRQFMNDPDDHFSFGIIVFGMMLWTIASYAGIVSNLTRR